MVAARLFRVIWKLCAIPFYKRIELKMPPVEENKIREKISGYFNKGDLTPFVKATFYMNPNVNTKGKTIILDLISYDAREKMEAKGRDNQLGCDLKIGYNL